MDRMAIIEQEAWRASANFRGTIYDLEDLIQEGWIRAEQSPAAEGGLLRTIVREFFIDLLRRHQHRSAIPVEDIDEILGQCDLDDAVIARDLLHRARLSSDQQDLLTALYIRGSTHRELAIEQGCSKALVTRRHRRAIRKLQAVAA